MKSSLDAFLRQADFSDLPEIHLVFKKSILETCKKDYTNHQRKAWTNAVVKIELWKKWLIEDYFIVAEYENKVIGFASLQKNDYLNLLYVHPGFIRKGVARVLYQNIKNKSLDLDANKLKTDASITAKPFFEKMGFIAVKENQNYLENEILVNYRMEENF